MGDQGGCELRSEAFVKIQKKKLRGGGRVGGGGVGLGVRVDVNGGVKLLRKFKKKFGGGMGAWVRGGRGWFGGGGQGGWEQRIEAFVKI